MYHFNSAPLSPCIALYNVVAADLLSKSFNYNNKVELKTSSSSGVNYTAEAVVSKPGEYFWPLPLPVRVRPFIVHLRYILLDNYCCWTWVNLCRNRKIASGPRQVGLTCSLWFISYVQCQQRHC